MRNPLLPPPPNLDGPPPDRLAFFLGGRDREMAEIARLTRSVVASDQVFDKELAWGARASAYAREIEGARARGFTPVLVELSFDAPPGDAIIVDHHGARAGEPCALAQVFALLRLPPERWTREYALVAANDVGHIAGMRAIGASAEEIARLRAEDRAAQGVTAQEEAEGRAAIERLERPLDHVLLVRLPHERTATVADPLALDGQLDGETVLLVRAPRGLYAFGPGAALRRLDQALPGGFSGGDLPERGFWGAPSAPPHALATALAALKVAQAEI